MLVLDGGKQVLVIRLPEKFKRLGAQGFGDALQKGGRRLRAVRFFQHGAGVFHAAVRNHLLRQAQLVEILQDRFGLAGREAGRARDFKGGCSTSSSRRNL